MDTVRFRSLPSWFIKTCLIAVLALGGIGFLSMRYIDSDQVNELEARVTEIDARLDSISSLAYRGGKGTIGYHSKIFDKPDENFSFTVNWKKDYPIDEIILVPVISQSGIKNFNSFGVPLKFKLICGASNDQKGTVIAQFDESDELLPRLSPIVVPCPPDTIASWLRIEVDRLSASPNGDGYIFMLSEIMAFSGLQNVAQNAQLPNLYQEDGSPLQPRIIGDRVLASLRNAQAKSWHPINLVDGHTPYVMNSNRGTGSSSVLSKAIKDHPAWITIDLGDQYLIDSVQMHTAQSLATIPVNFDEVYALPRFLEIQISNDPDFSEATIVRRLRYRSDYESGPINVARFSPTKGRYIRLVAQERHREVTVTYGFSEIEVYSGYTNVALKKPISINYELIDDKQKLEALNDGKNLFGEVIPIRQWLNELYERHELENERPTIIAALGVLYTRQKQWVIALFVIVVLLIIAIVYAIYSGERMRKRAIQQTRNRIAADLHDEFSANVHAIRIMGKYAESLANTPEKQLPVLRRLQQAADETVKSTKHYTNILESEELCLDFATDAREILHKLLPDLDTHISIDDEEILKRMDKDTRIDLFLFYKECITNILRHSKASSVNVSIKVDESQLHLKIEDNGLGIQGQKEGFVPQSLRRRVRYMRAKIESFSPQNGGTCIYLQVPLPHSTLMPAR
ncbi:MAG: discoidin domain-containing protein [Opitutales bacterium]